jgi:hypothetical protein
LTFRERSGIDALHEHSSAYRAGAEYTRRLRGEITEHLRRHGNSELAAAVAMLDDERTLKAIVEIASRLDRELSPETT